MHLQLQRQISVISAQVDKGPALPLEPQGPSWQQPLRTPPIQPDPLETCVMRPPPTSSPMDLRVPQQILSAALPPIKDISPPPESHLASALTSLEGFQMGPYPFVGSDLSGLDFLLLDQPWQPANLVKPLLLRKSPSGLWCVPAAAPTQRRSLVIGSSGFTTRIPGFSPLLHGLPPSLCCKE